MSQKRVAAVLLAAGASTRSENPKQLLLYKEKTLLRHTAEVAVASRCRPVCVVLGAEARRLIWPIAALKTTIVVNEDWEEGISSSIRAGLYAALRKDEDLDAVLYMTVDQPLVTPKVLDSLVELYMEGHPQIVACSYDDTLGVPALFDRSLFDSIKGLKGDSGAKQVILQHREETAVIDCPGAGIDIDTEEDLARLNKNQQNL